jgi:hypothetical protein
MKDRTAAAPSSSSSSSSEAASSSLLTSAPATGVEDSEATENENKMGSSLLSASVADGRPHQKASSPPRVEDLVLLQQKVIPPLSAAAAASLLPSSPPSPSPPSGTTKKMVVGTSTTTTLAAAHLLPRFHFPEGRPPPPGENATLKERARQLFAQQSDGKLLYTFLPNYELRVDSKKYIYVFPFFKSFKIVILLLIL